MRVRLVGRSGDVESDAEEEESLTGTMAVSSLCLREEEAECAEAATVEAEASGAGAETTGIGREAARRTACTAVLSASVMRRWQRTASADVSTNSALMELAVAMAECAVAPVGAEVADGACSTSFESPIAWSVRCSQRLHSVIT